MRTWFGDVGEARLSRSHKCAVHVLAESHHHEELCLEPLGVAVRQPLQQLEGIPLVIGPDYDLIDGSQNSNFEVGPQDC